MTYIERLRSTGVFRLGLFCLFSLLLTGTATTQTTMPLTQPGNASGSPAGSYALSGFENVNIFNGKLNFHLPLLEVGGRGDAGYTINLNIEASWHINRVRNPNLAPYDNPEDYDWGANPGYSPGIMFAQSYTSYTPLYCDPGSNASMAFATLTKLTFKTQEGTSIEFVDQASYGSIQGGTDQCPGSAPLRGSTVAKSL